MGESFADVDAYIGSFPADVQQVLDTVRRTLHEAVPGAGERISYQIPTITVDGRSLVHFAGWKRHISLYPGPEGDADLDAALAPYRSGQGTLRFPLDQPMPLALIARVARCLADQRMAD